MRIVQVNCIDPKIFEILFACYSYICSVAAETEAVWEFYAPEFGGEEDIFAFLWIESKPFADDGFGIALVGDLVSSLSEAQRYSDVIVLHRCCWYPRKYIPVRRRGQVVQAVRGRGLVMWFASLASPCP